MTDSNVNRLSSRVPLYRNSSSESIQTSNTANNYLSLNDIKTSNHAPESIYNLETVYKNNTRYATQSVLPPSDYHSPYYLPFNNIDDPRPVDQLIYRFSIWKMIIKQVIFYFKEMSVFKNQTFQGNRAMLENLEILKRQNSGKLKIKANANKSLKKSLSSSSFNDLTNNNLGSTNSTTDSTTLSINNNNNNSSINMDNLENEMNLNQQNLVNKLLQTTFLPPNDNSILSISSTFFNNHNYLKEKELLTYQHLTNRLIPRLENLKDQLNETIKQMNSIKNSSDYKTKNLKMEIAKTGGVLSDYVTSIELLKTGSSKSSLGTDIKLKDNKIDSKLDPYILKLKLDLQLKDQLYIEAHLKEMYYDLQFKAVQLEKILYTEIQNCISTYTDLIESELNVVKENLIEPFKNGFIKNEPTIDWDYFIQNDRKKNFLPINANNTLNRVKKVRKNSDIVYPYRNSAISSCIYSGYLDRKSKYLKNYSKFYYVLTINFLHEFKSNDRIKDMNPIQSFSLTDLTVATIDDDPKKFVIRVYKNNDKDSKTKFTFKSDSIDSTLKWVDYLADLTQFENTIERNASYDVSDDEDDDGNIETTEQCIPTTTEQNNFKDNYSNYNNNTVSSPSSNDMSHSRSTSDEFNPRSQYQQVQNSLQPDYFNQVNNNNANIGNVSFKSIKSQPNLRQIPLSSSANQMLKTNSISRTSSRTNSRQSSRQSSRASSPSAIRSSSLTRPLMSPKLGSFTSTNINATTPTGSLTSSGDYFSYAPRKVQASIIRNGNRLASTNSGRVTPGGGANTSTNSSLTLNVSIAKNPSSNNLNNIPKINIHDSTPINTERPTVFNDNDIDDFANSNKNNNNNNNIDNIGNENDTKPISSGLERRRKTLSEKLDITGLISANKLNSNSNILKLSDNSNESFGSNGLPETPGVIPGSMMKQLFISENGYNNNDINNNLKQNQTVNSQ